MTRKRNPRRVASEVIKAIHKNADAMRGMWDGPRHWVNPDTQRWEKAPEAEQPENRADDWRRLATFMGIISSQAADVKEYALRRAEEIEGSVSRETSKAS